jgi:hypothetical protein
MSNESSDLCARVGHAPRQAPYSEVGWSECTRCDVDITAELVAHIVTCAEADWNGSADLRWVEAHANLTRATLCNIHLYEAVRALGSGAAATYYRGAWIATARRARAIAGVCREL